MILSNFAIFTVLRYRETKRTNVILAPLINSLAASQGTSPSTPAADQYENATDPIGLRPRCDRGLFINV